MIMLSVPNISTRWMRQGVIVMVVAIATYLFAHPYVSPSLAQAGYSKTEKTNFVITVVAIVPVAIDRACRLG